MAKGEASRAGQWVLLCYRLPREPSTPRITIWRNLKRLGVGQLTDGLVTLPADARTREQLEWLAEKVIEFGGEASIWLAHPATSAHERQVAGAMASARTAEYQAVISDVTDAAALEPREQRRVASRSSAELRRIERRDFFPPPERDQARAAVKALLTAVERAAATGRAMR